jgi:glyoxylase-like metal-dependent hydrolase (beta-lactamase superfamily II)
VFDVELGPGDDVAGRLAALGVDPGEIGHLVTSHLHFDHAGGNTIIDGDGAIQLAFPRAKYHANRGEFEYAHWRNERVQASYMPNNFDPVQNAGALSLVEHGHVVMPGITMMHTPGHTPHHQSIVITSAGQSAVFLADVIPTSAHMPLPWIMGYDVEPLVTLESKRALLRKARDEQWLLIFEHDPVTAWGILDPGSEKPELHSAG